MVNLNFTKRQTRRREADCAKPNQLNAKMPSRQAAREFTALGSFTSLQLCVSLRKSIHNSMNAGFERAFPEIYKSKSTYNYLHLKLASLHLCVKSGTQAIQIALQQNRRSGLIDFDLSLVASNLSLNQEPICLCGR